MRCEQTLEEKFITGMIKRAEQSDELVFLMLDGLEMFEMGV